jgi:hypothetical protein
MDPKLAYTKYEEIAGQSAQPNTPTELRAAAMS